MRTGIYTRDLKFRSTLQETLLCKNVLGLSLFVFHFKDIIPNAKSIQEMYVAEL